MHRIVAQIRLSHMDSGNNGLLQLDLPFVPLLFTEAILSQIGQLVDHTARLIPINVDPADLRVDLPGEIFTLNTECSL